MKKTMNALEFFMNHILIQDSNGNKRKPNEREINEFKEMVDMQNKGFQLVLRKERRGPVYKWIKKMDDKIYYQKDQTKENLGEWIQGLNASGYAGILSNGNIVDRREFPEAIPVQKSSVFGTVEPKDL